jgi:hypothetical protein
MEKRISLVLGFCLGLLAVNPVRAEEPSLAPQHALVYNSLLALRYNPLGLEERLRVAYQYRLYDDPGLLWNSAYVWFALTPTINPAVTRLGARLEVQPLAVLQLYAGAYWVAWHGTFNYLQSYPSVTAAHSDSDLKDAGEAGANYVTTGHQLNLGGRLQAKVGNFVVRNLIDVFKSENDLHDGDRAFYDPVFDVMVGNGGWQLENDFDAVYLADAGWVAGIRAHVTHAWYDEDHFAPGEEEENLNTPSFRLGLLAAYVFDGDYGPYFEKPALILLCHWYLNHRYRTGEDVPQGIPYIGLAFSFNGTLWESR